MVLAQQDPNKFAKTLKSSQSCIQSCNNTLVPRSLFYIVLQLPVTADRPLSTYHHLEAQLSSPELLQFLYCRLAGVL